jgi:hypothetical protein
MEGLIIKPFPRCSSKYNNKCHGEFITQLTSNPTYTITLYNDIHMVISTVLMFLHVLLMSLQIMKVFPHGLTGVVNNIPMKNVDMGM